MSKALAVPCRVAYEGSPSSDHSHASQQLRELSNPSMSLSEVPPQAIRCRLAYVRCQELDDELGEEAAIQLHRLVWGKTLQATRAYGEGAVDDGSGKKEEAKNMAREDPAMPVSIWLGMAEGQDAGKDGDELSEKEAKRVAAAIKRGSKGKARASDDGGSLEGLGVSAAEVLLARGLVRLSSQSRKGWNKREDGDLLARMEAAQAKAKVGAPAHVSSSLRSFSPICTRK